MHSKIKILYQPAANWIQCKETANCNVFQIFGINTQKRLTVIAVPTIRVSLKSSHDTVQQIARSWFFKLFGDTSQEIGYYRYDPLRSISLFNWNFSFFLFKKRKKGPRIPKLPFLDVKFNIPVKWYLIAHELSVVFLVLQNENFTVGLRDNL